jgi:hypothetical protein
MLCLKFKLFFFFFSFFFFYCLNSEKLAIRKVHIDTSKSRKILHSLLIVVSFLVDLVKKTVPLLYIIF